MWRAWVALWTGTEHPRSLALVRILLGAVILMEFLEIWRLDLVVPLFGVADVGGMSDALTRANTPLYYQAFPGTVRSAVALHAVISVAALSFLGGYFTRTSALVLLLGWAQFAQILPAADRGIDTLCRDVLWIFTVAPAGACWSFDALWKTGDFRGDDSHVVCWPRKLILVQLIAIYFLAGVQKTGIHWYPMGHFASLYFILQDPAIARFDFAFTARQPWFFFTQVGSAVTILFQDTYPLVLLWGYYRRTADRPGWLRGLSNRWRFELLWILTGAVFHLLLAASMELGIFPWAMLALYPAWISPDLLGRWLPRIGG